MSIRLLDVFGFCLQAVMFGLIAGLLVAGVDLGPLGWLLLFLGPVGMVAFVHSWEKANA